jgi:Kef-type K+ transport system membrane component KefB
MITRALLMIGTVAALTYATRSFVPHGATITGSGAALAFGFLLVAAVQAAYICDALRIPRLTGYIVCGLAFGPELLGLVSAKMLPDLALVKGTAVGLIAFLAGCELNYRRLRPRLRAIGIVALVTMIGAVVLLFAFFYGITFHLPITADFTTPMRLAVALLCANILAAFSPAVVVAILSETRASGPLSEMSLSIVVLADFVIVISYALSSTIAHAIFPDSAGGGGMGVLVPHIFGSMVAGVIVGAVLAAYASRVESRGGVFTFAVLFVAAEAGAALHLNPLLVGLAAGLFLENVTPKQGERLLHDAESIALPTFAIFFAVVGAELQLRAFLHVAPIALAAAALRAIGIYAGAFLTRRHLGDITHTLPLGLLSQAGVAIALASLLFLEFPGWGQVLGTVVLGTIVVNQLIGPVLFRAALIRSGEAG